jgi:hypothetical protein
MSKVPNALDLPALPLFNNGSDDASKSNSPKAGPKFLWHLIAYFEGSCIG